MPDTLNAAARPVLSEAEATRRVVLLAELQAALDALGIQAVLVRNRRLVLRAEGSSLGSSGPTNPQLHVFLNDGTEVATTDGNRYEFTTAQAYPVGDSRATAVSLASRPHVRRQGQPR